MKSKVWSLKSKVGALALGLLMPLASWAGLSVMPATPYTAGFLQTTDAPSARLTLGIASTNQMTVTNVFTTIPAGTDGSGLVNVVGTGGGGLMSGSTGTNLTLVWGTNTLTATGIPWPDQTNFYVTPVAWNTNLGGKYTYKALVNGPSDVLTFATNGHYTLIYDPDFNDMADVTTITNDGTGIIIAHCTPSEPTWNYTQLYTNSALSSAYFGFFTNQLPVGWSFKGPISGDGSGLTNLTLLSGVDVLNVLRAGTLLRPELIEDIWGGQGLPTLGADYVTNNVTPPSITVAAPTNLLRSDAYFFNLKDQAGTIITTNLVYSFVPTNAGTRLVIYHGGHDTSVTPIGQPDYGNSPGPYNAGALVKQLVENGYTVVGIGMPFLWVGHIPPYIPTNCLRYFVEPTIRIINQFPNATTVFMVGISGGGWTTTLAAAIDPRITVTAPTAGSLPFYIPAGSRDYEQLLPGISAYCDYTNLYLLGATSGRTQVQYLNSADGVFSGNWTASYPDYVAATTAQASWAGGSWSRYITTSSYHSFDTNLQARIVNLFNAH